MIRDEIKEWLALAVVGAAAIVVIMVVVGTVAYDEGKKGARGSEERAEREYLMWHEECADLRETAMRRYEERRGRR